MPMMWIIEQYGYLAVFAGAFLEGEVVLILAGFAAFHGYLNLQMVLLIAFLGTVLSDEFFYYLGRWQGRSLIGRSRRLSGKYPYALHFIEHFGTWVVLLQRFLYGFRIAIPVAIGTSSMTPVRFALLNISSAVVWVLLFGYLGYGFGDALTAILGDLKRVEAYIFLGVFFLVLTIWAAHTITKKTRL